MSETLLNRYTFTIKSETPEDLPIGFFDLTLDDLKKLLLQIEFARTGDQPHANWKLVTDGIYVTASVNGLSSEQIKGILDDTYTGFKVTQSHNGADWPKSFDDNTKDILKRIVNRVSKRQAVVIETEDQEPLLIKPERATPKKQQEKYIAWSTVDGTLDVISVHARPFFVIYEHGTKTRVRCAFPDDWTEKVLKLLGHRVAIDGLVYYKQSGEPYQLSKPTSIEPVPQPQSDILSLRGAIKGMTGDLSTYDYVRKIRDKNSFD